MFLGGGTDEAMRCEVVECRPSSRVSVQSSCPIFDVVMPDFTVDVSTDPTHSSSDREREKWTSESSRVTSNVERVDTRASNCDSDGRGEGGAELRVEVGDAYIRELSGGE